jgi:hypothetical protein
MEIKDIEPVIKTLRKEIKSNTGSKYENSDYDGKKDYKKDNLGIE